jgi:hypothetical protein
MAGRANQIRSGISDQPWLLRVSEGRSPFGFPTRVSCGDVDARRYRKSYSDDRDQADPAIRPDLDCAAKDFGAVPVDHTYQNRLGDDDDARDAQRG